MQNLIYVDNLACIMMTLVSLVGLTVAAFATRYLKGDRKQTSFYINLLLLIAAVFVLVIADHLILLFAAWVMSNLLLTRLMLHKNEWPAARESSNLAAKNFVLGSVFLAGALVIQYQATHLTSIQMILQAPMSSNWLQFGGCLLILSAMTQSALWPFHQWLTSSLNSPTPVSAIMHAGLVNGGGFLMARFAPLFLAQSNLLQIIFILGMTTALLGTLWKLMQNDVKRMLAFSTMGQMGFMIAQCGLGLFPAAIAHLVWHGMFKAYLFFGSGSAAQENRLDLDYPPTIKQFLYALGCGITAAYVFSLESNKDIFAGNTTLFLVAIAMIAATQFALPIIRSHFRGKIPLALLCTTIMGFIYGWTVHLFDLLLAPLNISQPQTLSTIHFIALAALVGSWLSIMFGRFGENAKYYPEWMLKFYVKMLNASQPHPKTVTTYRKQYQY